MPLSQPVIATCTRRENSVAGWKTREASYHCDSANYSAKSNWCVKGCGLHENRRPRVIMHRRRKLLRQSELELKYRGSVRCSPVGTGGDPPGIPISYVCVSAAYETSNLLYSSCSVRAANCVGRAAPSYTRRAPSLSNVSDKGISHSGQGICLRESKRACRKDRWGRKSLLAWQSTAARSHHGYWLGWWL